MPSRGEAFDFLTREGPSLFGTSVGRLMYVGHRSDTHPWWHETFAPLVGADRISVLDIWQPNLASANHVTADLIHGDVLDPACVGRGPGLLFWDEGPEHVRRDQFIPWVRDMVDLGWSILVSCPWGYQAQGADGSNLSEEHLWGPTPADLEEAGLECRAFGEMFPEGHGNLIGWLRYDGGT
jgi:hypothetical protein